jgi:hypothetical protein
MIFLCENPTNVEYIKLRFIQERFKALSNYNITPWLIAAREPHVFKDASTSERLLSDRLAERYGKRIIRV